MLRIESTKQTRFVIGQHILIPNSEKLSDMVMFPLWDKPPLKSIKPKTIEPVIKQAI